MKNTYPEHEKLSRVNDKSQIIGEFLDWLRSEKHLKLAEWNDDGYLRPVYINTNDLLAEFFDIDLKKLESEKRTMLAVLRGEIKQEG